MPITSVKPWPPSLIDSELKTVRAKEHLETLRREIRTFGESNPYTFETQEDLERQRFKIKIVTKEIPNTIPLIAGDLFYCLRASLDRLVFSLARLTLPYPDRTQFPILEADSEKTRKRFAEQTAGVPAEAVSIIEELQPYHGSDTAAIRSHLLWRLNILCNIDKHRRIPMHSAIQDFSFFLPESVASAVEIEQDEVVSLPLSAKGKVEFDPKAPVNIVFGDMHEGIECNLEGVERIYYFVADCVLPRFARFFKQQV
jgi:hypothetical protein